MTIEVLYPELCNLYGDSANVRYLKACVPEAEIVYTDNRSKPRFVTERVDLIYLGSMSEPSQILAANRLLPYAERLGEVIRGGTPVLCAGNAVELLGLYIEDADGHTEDMLGLYQFYAKRDMDHRHNSMFLGDFGQIPIVGAKSQFSFLHGRFPGDFIRVRGGYGNNPEDKTEGFRDHNLFATYLLGPFLVLNPLFTKYLLNLLGVDRSLAFEKETMEAFTFRKEHLEEPGVKFLMGEHG